MKARPYDKSMLFMGVLSTRGFPSSLEKKLESLYGPILLRTEPFPFDFTDYYVSEMGEGIARFFIAFSALIAPDSLADVKTVTDEIEKEYSEDGKRKINLDPGLLTEANIILATTKNRSHRIAIGRNLYGEVTLIYQNHRYNALPWTYADYRSEKVQEMLISFRKEYLKARKADQN